MQMVRIAKKLSVQIKKEAEKIKMLLNEYNMIHAATTGDRILSVTDVFHSNILFKVLNTKFGTYSKEKQELIEAYLLLCRSSEELELLNCDMHNAIMYYENRIEIINAAIIDNQQDGAQHVQFKSGAHALLLHLKLQAEQELAKLRGLTLLCCNEEQSPHEDRVVISHQMGKKLVLIMIAINITLI